MAADFAKSGATVIALGRDLSKLEELKGDVETFVCDLNESDEVETTFAKIMRKPLHIVVFNAAVKITGNGPYSFESFRRTFEVNLLSTLRSLDTILPCFERQGFGHLVFISSLGDSHGMYGTNGYNSSKAALTIFAESLRMDFYTRKINIDITIVRPGLIRTGMLAPSVIGSLLTVSRETASRRIITAVSKRRNVVSFPIIFRLLAFVLSRLPRKMTFFVLNFLKGQ